MAHRALPQTFRKIIARQLSPKFREATEIISSPMLTPTSDQLLIKNQYMGINASDINYTAGRYDPTVKPPFDCGFEGIGSVVSVGPDCRKVKPGQTVGYMQYGAFSEYILVKESVALPLPMPKPEYLPLIVSGLTAAISLDTLGELKPNEKVLVTAAAGGTGQFAVQWAKQAGCHVIGVCSTEEKVKFLKTMGCDRVVNYTAEDLKAVLKTEYSAGIDVVYECVGGKMFETCLNAMAPKGRLIVIGYIEGYESKSGTAELGLQTPNLVRRLLGGSVSIRGFLVFHYATLFSKYLQRLVGLYEAGKLQSSVDLGTSSGGGKRFDGLEDVPRAVEYLYSRKNVGKVVVEFSEKSKL